MEHDISTHKYAVSGFRLNDRDKQRIADIKRKWNVNSDIAAVRIALLLASKQTVTPTPYIRESTLHGL